MAWDADRKELYVPIVDSADRTLSGGGVQPYHPIYPERLTARNVDDYFKRACRSLPPYLSECHRKKKGNLRVHLLSITVLDEAWKYLGHTGRLTVNGKDGKEIVPGNLLTFDEYVELSEELTKLRTNAHFGTTEIRKLLTVGTWFANSV